MNRATKDMGRFTNVTLKTKNKELSKEENAMKKIGSHAERGASIIEMVIVLAVIAIMVTFAIAQFGNANENFQRQNVAKEFKVNLERARYDSVKRHADDAAKMANVKVVNTLSYTVTTDMNHNDVLDAPETTTVDFSGRSDAK